MEWETREGRRFFIEKKGHGGGGHEPMTKQGTVCLGRDEKRARCASGGVRRGEGMPREGWEGVGGPPPPSLGCPIMLSVGRGIKPWRGPRNVTPSFEYGLSDFCQLCKVKICRELCWEDCAVLRMLEVRRA